MKKVFGAMMAVMLAMVLTACGSPAANTETEAAAAVEAEAAPNAGQAAAESAAADQKEFENLYPSLITGETDTSVTYIDKSGTETTITKKPEKVVVLYNSLLDLWYDMGGTSLTKVKGTTNVPEEAKDLTDLGSSSSVSLEAVIAFEPDLVIISGSIDSQVAMAPNLNEMGIETMIIDAKTRSYERFAENSYLFSKVLGTEDLYADKTQRVMEEVETIIALAASADETPRVAPIFASAKSMYLETDLAQVGEMVAMLGGVNIYSADDQKAEGETRVSFSIEALVTQNPQVILISTMGSIEGAKENISAMIAENPVWHEVDAVKNDRVFYLDKALSVYKPNQRYAEAFLMVAERLYPDLFPAD